MFRATRHFNPPTRVLRAHFFWYERSKTKADIIKAIVTSRPFPSFRKITKKSPRGQINSKVVGAVSISYVHVIMSLLFDVKKVYYSIAGPGGGGADL